MSFYGILLLIHILGAICGIGAQFAQPFILKNPKTVKQAEFAHHVNHGVDKLVVIGTFTLLISGLIMGILNTHLFTQGWYIISLILFITILPVAGAIVPKKAAKQVEILKNHKEMNSQNPILQSKNKWFRFIAILTPLQSSS